MVVVVLGAAAVVVSAVLNLSECSYQPASK
jgi:hypothetical protein